MSAPEGSLATQMTELAATCPAGLLEDVPVGLDKVWKPEMHAFAQEVHRHVYKTRRTNAIDSGSDESDGDEGKAKGACRRDLVETFILAMATAGPGHVNALCRLTSTRCPLDASEMVEVLMRVGLWKEAARILQYAPGFNKEALLWLMSHCGAVREFAVDAEAAELEWAARRRAIHALLDLDKLVSPSSPTAVVKAAVLAGLRSVLETKTEHLGTGGVGIEASQACVEASRKMYMAQHDMTDDIYREMADKKAAARAAKRLAKREAKVKLQTESQKRARTTE
jgi:hypothetical protein